VSALLASPEGLRFLRQQRQWTKGRPRRKAELLLQSMTLAYLRDRVAAGETRLREALRGKLLGAPLAYFPEIIVGAEDAAERKRLDELYAGALRPLEPLWLDRRDDLQRAAQDAGFADFPALVWETFEIDGEECLNVCAEIVGAPDGRGQGPVGEIPSLRDFVHDGRRLLAERSGRPGLVEGALKILRSLGLPRPVVLEVVAPVDPESGGGVGQRIGPAVGRAYSEWTPGSEQARLIVREGPGLTSLEHVLHEAGHAAEGCSRDPGGEVEFATLVDLSISEAWAFIIAAAAHNPSWIRELLAGGSWADRPGPALLDDLAQRIAAAHRRGSVYSVRKQAALVLLSSDLYGPRAGGAGLYPEAYGRIMTEVTGISHQPATAYSDTDDLWRTAAYLRGYALAALALESLHEGGARDLGPLAARGALSNPGEFAAYFEQTLDLRAAGRYASNDR
jgi:hypothetical protein